MAEWIQNGEELLSIRNKLNSLESLTGVTSGSSGISGSSGKDGNSGSSGKDGSSAQSGITSGFLSSRLAIATSYKAIEQKKYTIGYSTDTSDDNIAIDITLTPGNTNKLLNIIESFNDS